MNKLTREEAKDLLVYLDEDIGRIPDNKRLKLKMLEKQKTSPEQMKIFIKEMEESEKFLKSKRLFLFIDYYLNKL